MDLSTNSRFARNITSGRNRLVLRIFYSPKLRIVQINIQMKNANKYARIQFIKFYIRLKTETVENTLKIALAPIMLLFIILLLGRLFFQLTLETEFFSSFK